MSLLWQPTMLRLRFARLLALVPTVFACQSKEEGTRVLPLWPEGAPGSERRRAEPEELGKWWVKNVHAPALTAVLPPAGMANGTGIVILPGGGHERLVFGPEGLAPARLLARRGFAAFVLKYRLAAEVGSSYRVEVEAAADAARAIRLVRSMAKELGVRGDRLGVWGWSAGAEVAHFVSFGPGAGNAEATDPVERMSARPDFSIEVYPGPRGLPPSLPPDCPPAFLVAAFDDPDARDVVLRLAQLYQAAGVPAEVHLYAGGGHGFNLGERSALASVRSWPDRLFDWLDDPRHLPSTARAPGASK
jgi:acetyl esterase/lipase